MQKVSKLGIYVPSILLLIAIVVVFTAPRKDPKVLEQKMLALTPTITPTPTPTVHISINLKGPFVCNYTSETATVSASIKNKQVAADFIEATQESHFILHEDCLYAWDNQKAVGQKTCGLGTVISTLDLLSSMGIMDIGSLMSMIPASATTGAQKEMGANSKGIKEFLKTCIKKEPTKEVFAVPVNILFLEPTAAPTPRL